MHYYHVQNISLQQIEIFLKVMELRNFTKTAEYLNFTVSMISKTISNMEKETGLILFLRKPRELAPTPAAIVLANEWQNIIKTVEQSMEKAHIAQNGARTVLNLGQIDSSSEVDEKMNQFLEQYEKKHPLVDIHVEKQDMHELVERLNAGELDVICTGHHESIALDAYKLPWKMLVVSPLVVYIPESCPLFYKEKLQFSDFRHAEFVIPSPVLHTSYYTVLDTLCRSYGFTPRIGATVPNVRSMAYALQRQKGIVLSCMMTNNWLNEHIRPFVLPEQGGVLVAWGKNPCRQCRELVEQMTLFFAE